MKASKVLLTIIASAVLLVAGCGTSSQTNSSSASETAAVASNAPENKPKLIMVTSPVYPPFEFTDTASGSTKIQGIDIDIADYLAEQLGFEYTVTNMNFTSIIGALAMGRADFAISAMAPTSERMQNADFSELYFIARQSIIWKGDGKTKYTSLKQLEGKKVGVEMGTLVEQQAKTVNNAKVVAMNENAGVVQDVLAGRLDAGLVDSTQAEGFLKTNPGLETSMLPEDEQDEKGYAIVFPKDSEWTEKFNNELNKMKENGELNKIIRKWLGPAHEFKN